MKIRGRKARTFRFRKTSFVHPRSRTYYALLLGCFGLKFLPDVLHRVYWVLDEIWVPDSSHKIGNKFFIHHCQDWKEGSFVFETVWFFSWANTHPFDLKFVAFCPKFSGDSYVEFQEKSISGEFFWNFGQTKAILYRNLWNFSLLSEILFWVRIALKKFKQVLSYVVCTRVRRHVHKKNHKKKIRGRKARTFCFRKTSFVHPRSGTYYALLFGFTVWNFYQTFFTVSTECWLRFEPQIRPTRLAINFLFITARTEKKVRLCVKLFGFFRGPILIRSTWNLSPFVPNSVEILMWNFRKKLFRENFSEILCKPRLSFTETCEISFYFMKFYSASVLRWKNSNKYFHMLFAHG